MRAVAAILLLAFALPAAAGSATCAADGPERYSLSVLADGGRSLAGIGYRRMKLGDRWVLSFPDADRRAAPGGGVAAAAGSWSMDDYRQALVRSLTYLVAERGARVDEIQVGAYLVEETQRELASAVRSAARNNTGIVMSKDPSTSRALAAAVAASRQVRLSCETLKAYGLACASPAASIDEVAYRSEFLRRGWNAVADAPDAGLASGTWFSIRVVRRPSERAPSIAKFACP